jgi:hypothetical protein
MHYFTIVISLQASCHNSASLHHNCGSELQRPIHYNCGKRVCLMQLIHAFNSVLDEQAADPPARRLVLAALRQAKNEQAIQGASNQ